MNEDYISKMLFRIALNSNYGISFKLSEKEQNYCANDIKILYELMEGIKNEKC